jgi:hypothetical protein
MAVDVIRGMLWQPRVIAPHRNGRQRPQFPREICRSSTVIFQHQSDLRRAADLPKQITFL